jgi:hypothetical protein
MIYTNKRRAARALAALRGVPMHGRPAGYYNHSKRDEWRECSEDGIADLLTDLRHLCDALNLDFAKLDNRAYDHYSSESGCEPEL